MKKIVLLFMIAFSVSFAQEEVVNTEENKSNWTRTGVFTFLLNQSAFSNWQAGGENSGSANVKINYDFNYKKDAWLWDNKILASYGLIFNEDDGLRKNDDRLEFNSILGKELTKEWNFSFFMNFRTQFTDGYDYEDFDGDNEDFATSGLFKPAYLAFGPGLLWKKSDNFYVNTAPATAKFTFITDEIFTWNEDDNKYDSSNDVKTFGVDPGESTLFEFGLNVRAYYKFDLAKNVNIENILNLYSNYIDKPGNVDVDYTLNLVMQINEALSTNFTFQTIYDENAYAGFQVREVFGLGLNYAF